MACLLFSSLTPGMMAQAAASRRVDELTAETAQLKRTIADQDRRIAELEKTVKVLQAMVVPAGIPPATPPWQRAPTWNLVKKAMSRAQVVDILGSPASEESVIDTQVLYYRTTSGAATPLNASVTFIGDRVTTVVPPAF